MNAQDAPPYDPGLPILRELEREVTRHARQAMAAGPDRSATSSRGRARRSRRARRVLVLGGLATLVAGTAAATRLVDGGPVAAPSATVDSSRAVVLSRAARDAEEGWRLRARADARRVCLALELGATEVQRCVAPPASRHVVVQSAIGSERRYVFGLAGDAVARVRLDSGSRRVVTRVRPIRSERLLLEAALPPGVGFFVAALGTATGRAGDVLRVQALAASGRAVGRVQLDCTIAAEACRPRGGGR